MSNTVLFLLVLLTLVFLNKKKERILRITLDGTVTCKQVVALTESPSV